MAKLISRRYADALFSTALEEGKIDKFEKEAEFVLDAFDKNREFESVINHPQIDSREKQKIMEGIFKNKISSEMMGLFVLILKKNRETEIKHILQAFLKKVMQHKGITDAYIYSASQLSKNQLESIKDKLSQNLKKQIVIHTEVDPDLIGGLKIFADGMLIDGTVSKKLADIKKSLLNASAQ